MALNEALKRKAKTQASDSIQDFLYRKLSTKWATTRDHGLDRSYLIYDYDGNLVDNCTMLEFIDKYRGRLRLYTLVN